MRQGPGIGRAGSPYQPPFARRAVLGVVRRGKHLMFREGRRFHRVPLGVARGLLVESDLRGPAYLPLGLYEYETHAWLRRFAEPGGLVFDVGAASGVTSLAIARLTGRPVVAFEPDGPSLDSLREHLRCNGDLGRLVHVVPQFVGRDTGDGRVSLDDYVRDTEPPRFVKVDVEGSELDVLSGAGRLLAERQPHLLIETHSRELEDACAQTLCALGYEPIVIRRRSWLREDRPAAHNQWLAAASPRTAAA